MPRERRLAFGEVAELYDRARPGYPAELADDVLSFADARAGDRALEVGAGTGKATALFADRGVEISALEPSEEMATVLARNCAGRPNVVIERGAFEDWDARGERFRLVYSAQAWHWVRPEVRYIRARELLETGGALAAFWNRPDWAGCPFREEIVEVYGRVVPDLGAGAGPGPMHPSAERHRDWWADWSGELEAAHGFDHPEQRSYRWRERYTTDSYLQVLRTHSDHILLGEDRFRELADAVGTVLDRHGGELPIDYVTDVWMARATGDSTGFPG